MSLGSFIEKVTTYEPDFAPCAVDFIHLKDGRVLGVNGECVVLYASMDDFNNNLNNVSPVNRKGIELI